MRRCHACGAPWEGQARIPGVKETCIACSAYLHCCKNCLHYDPSRHNQCYIPTTDWVSDKEGANFCDEFVFADTDAAKQTSRKAESARNQLDALLGGGTAPAEDATRDVFNRLFGEEQER